MYCILTLSCVHLSGCDTVGFAPQIAQEIIYHNCHVIAIEFSKLDKTFDLEWVTLPSIQVFKV